jgi:hypothetical protein
LHASTANLQNGRDDIAFSGGTDDPHAVVVTRHFDNFTDLFDLYVHGLTTGSGRLPRSDGLPSVDGPPRSISSGEP